MTLKGWAASTAAMVLAGSAQVAGAGAGPVTVYFDAPAGDVADRLANSCADRQEVVVEQDDRHVLCQRENGGVAARYIMGGGQAPVLNIRFSILKARSGVRVQALQWMETSSALGQQRRMELNDRKHADALAEVLYKLGAHDLPAEERGDVPDGASAPSG